MNYIVKDLMVPISEYATVSKGATLFDAVLALEEAQVNFDRSKYLHRAILVLDKDNQVVGKLSQLNVLRALGAESGKKKPEITRGLDKFGFSPQFVSTMDAEHLFEGRSFKEICAAPSNMKVENFMMATSAGEYADEDAPLETVVPQFLSGRHLSLLVTRKEGDIIGILRLSDVFAAVFHMMEESQQENQSTT